MARDDFWQRRTLVLEKKKKDKERELSPLLMYESTVSLWMELALVWVLPVALVNKLRHLRSIEIQIKNLWHLSFIVFGICRIIIARLMWGHSQTCQTQSWLGMAGTFRNLCSQWWYGTLVLDRSIASYFGEGLLHGQHEKRRRERKKKKIWTMLTSCLHFLEEQ